MNVFPQVRFVRKPGENFYVSHSEKVVLLWNVEPISKTVRDQQGQRRSTRRIVSTAVAATWAARQTSQQARDVRARHLFQRMMARQELRSANGSGAGQAVCDDWQAFLRLGDGLGAQ